MDEPIAATRQSRLDRLIEETWAESVAVKQSLRVVFPAMQPINVPNASTAGPIQIAGREYCG